MPQYRIVPLRQCPDLAGPAAEWFAAKWGIPIAEYRASIDASLQAPDRVPQWYLALDGGCIAAGAGLIENDFHDRPDLAPNLCALFVQPPTGAGGWPGSCWITSAATPRGWAWTGCIWSPSTPIFTSGAAGCF